MSGAPRRGACPSLSAPMQTGDGLLVRLASASRMLSSIQLAGVARAALRHGNGLLEVTRRGNLQIRGLTAQSAQALADEILGLRIAVSMGVPVETGPLAGMDAQEIADPRPLADAIKTRVSGLAARLGPKVSVTVDGGGRLHLGALIADVKLTAIAMDSWRVAIGGNAASARQIGVFAVGEAVAKALFVLELLARRGRMARARDLGPDDLPAISSGQDANTAQPVPVGAFALKDGGGAQGFALAFGQIDGETLRRFAQALAEDEAIRLAPGGGLVVTGLASDRAAMLRDLGERLGLVTQAHDPRLAIVACAGAPACGSAWVATRALAADLAARGTPGRLVHLSGCAKGCARPSAPALTLTGTTQGCVVDGDGRLARTLLALAGSHFVQRESA